MNNVKELIAESVKVFKALRAGEISVAEANGLNNTTSGIIKAAKVKLEYNKLQGDHSKIDFLEGN